MSSALTTDSHRIITPLDEHNYQTWKFDMQARLMQSTVAWLIVAGELPAPATTADADERRAYQIGKLHGAGLIYNNVSPSIQPFLHTSMDNPKAMWDTLKKKFKQQNSTARFMVFSNLLTVQKQPDESLSALIG